MRFSFLRALSLLLCLALLSGCTLFQDQPTASTQTEEVKPSSGINLTNERTDALFTLGWSPELSIHPMISQSTVNWTFLPLIYEGLYQLTPTFDAEPVLCQEATASDDGRTWVFRLRQDAKFSNGVTMTAADVVYSLELARGSTLYGARLGCINTVTQSGQYEVTITLSHAMGSLPLLLDVPIIRSGTAENPLGTGPYMLVHDETDDYLEYVPGWHGGSVPAGRVYLYQVSNADSVRDAFEFGHVDLVVSDLNAVGAVNFHSNYELWSQNTTIMQFLAFNGESDLFRSAPVRAAVTHAIDRQALITELFDGYGVAATLPAHPLSHCYDLALSNRFGYDKDVLTTAVADAGLAGQRGTLLVSADNAANVAAAEAIAAGLRDAGLEITVTAAAGADYNTLLEAGGYDLAYCELRMTPDFDLSAFFGGALSAYAIQHDDAPALCDLALENIGNFYDLHKLIMEEGLLCPLLFKTRAVMTDRGSVSGLNAAPVNVFYGLTDLSINH